MKQLVNLKSKIFFSMAGLLLTALAFAQDDKKLDVDINVNKQSEWYAQPWVWIIGGAVFILLLVALLRGGKKD